jgi:hypothetical protein
MGDSNLKSITVETMSGSVVVRRLALGDYAALLRALKSLSANLGAFVGENSTDKLKDNSFLMAELPALIADSIPEFCDLLAIASDKDAKFFLEGDLADALEVFMAALELNDYSRIADTVKKLTAGKPARAQTKA